jgi:hypothetical protein
MSRVGNVKQQRRREGSVVFFDGAMPEHAASGPLGRIEVRKPGSSHDS